MLTKERPRARRLDPDSYTPIYVQLKEALLEFIQSEEVRIGQKILSLNQLKERYAASDTTCKKAISELMHEGVLEGRQGKGVYVTSKFPATAVKEVTLVVKHGPDILRHPAFAEVVNGIMHEIGRGNTRLSFVFIDTVLMTPEELEGRIAQIKSAGVIIPLIPGLTGEMLKPLRYARLPVVFITERFPEISPYLVKWDIRSMMHRMVGDILAEGRKTIALVGSPWDTIHSDIQGGIQDAFKKTRRVFSDEYVRRGPYSVQTGRNAMKNMLSSGLRPDVVIANDDMVAQGVMEYLNEQGISVPGRMEVLAVGGFLKHLPYELSSICMPYFELGVKAARMVMSLTQGREPEHCEETIPCSFKPGNTMRLAIAKHGRRQ